MADSNRAKLSPGQVLAGKFRVEEVLGQGAMGVVVAAQHLQLDERVAIKFLLPAALENREAVERFMREARTAAKIRSEYVARVSDVGTLEGGEPYMVMEHLTGSDLKQYLAEHGKLSLAEVVRYTLQACEALSEAHAMGIVHRDLKPANLFRIVRKDGTPSIKVLDFGISKLANAETLTQAEMMLGSPYYMSPEQMTSSKDVDARTDIWALGAIMYQLLTSQLPFPGQSLPEVCQSVLSKEPTEISRLRPDLPPEFDRVIERALRKDRADRFENVAGLSRALAIFGDDHDHESVERINRVLGEARTETSPRTSESPGSGRLQRVRISDNPSSGRLHRPQTPEPESEYRPPTKSSRGPLMFALLGGAALAALVVLRPRSSEQAQDATSFARPIESGRVPAQEQKSPTSNEPSEGAAQTQGQAEGASAAHRASAKPRLTVRPSASAGVPTAAERSVSAPTPAEASVGEAAKPAQEPPPHKESALNEEQTQDDESLPEEVEEKPLDPYESRR